MLCVYRMAEKYNMKLLFTFPFADYFQQKIRSSENRGLIGRMQGLEVDYHRLLINTWNGNSDIIHS